MLHLLRRHPLPIQAYFNYSLVLTFAFPPDLLTPMLPPGLSLDTWNDYGFLAIAMVDTVGLRPAHTPRFIGQDFFLTGYRIFTRINDPKDGSQTSLRGLRILRSDTNKARMVFGGNLLTHYAYTKAQIEAETSDDLLRIALRTPGGQADLRVIADLASIPARLPDNSPFNNLAEARRFAGPLPYTFDYESETNSIVMVRATRQEWDPQPVAVEVLQNTFFERAPFSETKPRLANAFLVSGVPYRWERGQLFHLGQRDA